MRVCLAFSNLQGTIGSCACVLAMNRLLEAWLRPIVAQFPQFSLAKVGSFAEMTYN
jgi:hypothetical protein